MEWLEKILEGNEKKAEIVDAIKKEMALHMIPKEKFNEVNTELKASKEQLTKSEEAMKGLADKAKSADEKETLINKLKADSEAFKADTEKRIVNTQKHTALQLALSGEVDKAAVDLIAGLVNLDSVEYDNGKITNYDELIKPIREERKTLFKEVTRIGTPPGSGGNPPSGDDNLSDAEYFSKMGVKPLI
jgi:hypothetical protein